MVPGILDSKGFAKVWILLFSLASCCDKNMNMYNEKGWGVVSRGVDSCKIIYPRGGNVMASFQPIKTNVRERIVVFIELWFSKSFQVFPKGRG